MFIQPDRFIKSSGTAIGFVFNNEGITHFYCLETISPAMIVGEKILMDIELGDFGGSQECFLIGIKNGSYLISPESGTIICLDD